jgi:hypothetical protein
MTRLPDSPPERPCPDPEDLARFMDGGLDEPARAGLEEHLAACADCRATIAVAAKALSAATPARRLLPRLAMAASFLALVAASWLALRGERPTSTAPEPRLVAVPAPGSGAAGTATGLELVGGFLASSGDGETTSLCVQSDGDTLRWALVRGSLFVELGPNAPPVRVVTPHASVTIHPGEVRMNISPAQTDVLVAAGKAVVEGSAAGGEGLTLAAGQSAAAAAKRAPVPAAREAAGPAPEWVLAARVRHLEDVMTSAFPPASDKP